MEPAMDFPAAYDWGYEAAASEGKLEQLRDMIKEARWASCSLSLPCLMPRAGRCPVFQTDVSSSVVVVYYLLYAYPPLTDTPIPRSAVFTAAAIGGIEVVSLLLLSGRSSAEVTHYEEMTWRRGPGRAWGGRG